MSAKLFLGGLPTTVTTEALRDYFSQFGEVVDAVNIGGRGFGFVTFDSADTAMEVLGMEHVVEDRKLDVKEATMEGTKGAPAAKGGNRGGKGGGSFMPFSAPMMPAPMPAYAGGGGKNFGGKGGGGKGKGGAGRKTDKIFVGGLPQEIGDDQLIEYFEVFGNLVDAVVMKDKATGKTRGFGFVQFDNAESADAVIAGYENHQIGGKWIEVKRASPKDQMAPPMGPVMVYGAPPGYGGGCYGVPVYGGGVPVYGGGAYGMGAFGPAPVYGGKAMGKGYSPYK